MSATHQVLPSHLKHFLIFLNYPNYEKCQKFARPDSTESIVITTSKKIYTIILIMLPAAGQWWCMPFSTQGAEAGGSLSSRPAWSSE